MVITIKWHKFLGINILISEGKLNKKICWLEYLIQQCATSINEVLACRSKCHISKSLGWSC